MQTVVTLVIFRQSEKGPVVKDKLYMKYPSKH